MALPILIDVLPLGRSQSKFSPGVNHGPQLTDEHSLYIWKSVDSKSGHSLTVAARAQSNFLSFIEKSFSDMTDASAVPAAA
jgi:hypothetical protein